MGTEWLYLTLVNVCIPLQTPEGTLRALLYFLILNKWDFVQMTDHKIWNHHLTRNNARFSLWNRVSDSSSFKSNVGNKCFQLLGSKFHSLSYRTVWAVFCFSCARLPFKQIDNLLVLELMRCRQRFAIESTFPSRNIVTMFCNSLEFENYPPTTTLNNTTKSNQRNLARSNLKSLIKSPDAVNCNYLDKEEYEINLLEQIFSSSL